MNTTDLPVRRARRSPEAIKDAQSPAFPASVLLLVTTRCNLRCAMCSYGGRRGSDLSLDTIRRLAQEMESGGVQSVYVSGGEPMLHPSLPQIVDALAARGLRVRLSINGTRLDDANVAALANVHSVSISLDGPSALHDEIRGTRGAFKRAVDAISLVRTRFPELPLSISATVLPANAAHVEELLVLARDAGVDVGFQPFVPSFAAVEQRRTIEEAAASTRDVMAALFRRLTTSTDKLANLREYYALCEDFVGRNGATPHPCAAGRGICVVNVDGTVAPCGGFPGVGQLATASLASIVDSRAYRGLVDRARRKECAGCLFYCFYYPAGELAPT